MQYIYQFYNKHHECIYVGKTNNPPLRFSQHKRDKDWFNEVEYIKYAECPIEYMIDIYEIYYINKINPKYNKKDIKLIHSYFQYPELNFKLYEGKNGVQKCKGGKQKMLNEIHNYFNIPYQEGKTTTLGLISITNELKNDKNLVTHHILLADVSGSMYSNLELLKIEILTVLNDLKEIPNSYVSVISYSGHNQSERILSGIKCDDITYKINKVKETIEEKLVIKGITVMSEPLEQSIEICESLIGICDKHHIALFTDGYLVPNKWSTQTEETRCYRVAEICKDRGIFLNAIGFGQHYDRKFLQNLVNIAGTGAVYHMNNIEDYYLKVLFAIQQASDQKMFKNIVNVVHEKTVLNLKNGQFLSIGENTLMGETLKLAVFNQNSINIDGNDYVFPIAIEKEQTQIPILLDDYYYAMAKHYLEEEDIDNYEYMVKAVGDINLYKETANCYSFMEKGQTLNTVTDYLNDETLRMRLGRLPILTTVAEEPLCVLEILQKILNDENSQLYWDTDINYHRITQKNVQIEDDVTFKLDESQLIPIYDLSIGSDKLNIGVKVGLSGVSSHSKLNISAPCKIYRDYNIINNGNVNVPYLIVKLSSKLKEELSQEGILVEDKKHSIPNVVDFYKINFEASHLKTANRRLLKSLTLPEVVQKLEEIADLKCSQWALNKRLKEVLEEKGITKLDLQELSEEEKAMRNLLRINEKGIYEPLKVEKDNNTVFDTYQATFLSWDIKFPEKQKKEEYLDLVSNENDPTVLEQQLEKVRKQLRLTNLQINCVRIASGIIGKPAMLFDMELEKPKTSTDKVLGINTIVDGKIKEWKKVFNDKIITQQQWQQIIKCN